MPGSGGDALIAGYSISSAMEKVYMAMGVCPQFDILYPDLTVRQHVEFFAKVKGVPPNQVKEYAKQLLEKVDLSHTDQVKVKNLSGGMRRRLSFAISLLLEIQKLYF